MNAKLVLAVMACLAATALAGPERPRGVVCPGRCICALPYRGGAGELRIVLRT